MMLIVDAPDGTDLDAVHEELARTRERLALDALSLSPLADARGRRARAPTPSHIVTVYGVDHPGIVHAVSARLAARAVNVTDLETRLVGEAGTLVRDGARGRAARRASTRRRSPRCSRRSAPSRGSRSRVRPLEADVHVSGRDGPPLPAPGAQAGGARGSRRRAAIARVARRPARHDGRLRPLRRARGARSSASWCGSWSSTSAATAKATSSNGRLVLVNPRIVARRGRRGRARGLPEHPRPDRERAPRDADRGRGRPDRRDRARRASRPAACSTRSTTSTACSSSTASTRSPRMCSAQRGYREVA